MGVADFRFFHRLRVRWAEVDRQDVVFNANYLLYFDVGVTEYWRDLVVTQQGDLAANKAQMAMWMHNVYVVKSTVEYHGSALVDDELDIGVRLAKIGRSSMTWKIEIHRGAGDAAQHLISGELVYVYRDPELKKSAPIPEPLKGLMVAFEKVKPDQR